MNWKDEVLKLTNFNYDIFNKLENYVDLVIENNKKFNLTGFDEEKIWEEGIYQSIVLLDSYLSKFKNIKVLDIGAGAGFPSVPYLIFANNCFELTIIESNLKRINFLKLIKTSLNLNINLIYERAENVKQFEEFDFITARAVTSLKNLIEISAHLGKINATYFFLKSKKYELELAEANWIFNELKLTNLKIKSFDLKDGKEHYVISYQKKHSTPKKYPRNWATIIKK